MEMWQTYLKLATSLRSVRLTVGALASSISRLPMPVLSAFPTPTTYHPEDRLQPVPVGDPHGYGRRRAPVSVVGVVFPPSARRPGRRANTVGIRERSAAFPPSLIKARWHTRLSFKPVGYRFSPTRRCRHADLPIEEGEPCTVPMHSPRLATYIRSAEHISCAVGGWWYGGISGHTLSNDYMA